MRIPYPSFVGPSYTPQSPSADCERTINMYTETRERPGAKAQKVLYQAPGFVTRLTAALAPGRALFAQDGRLFAVIGQGFFEIYSDWTKTQYGTVDRNSDPATICSSGDGGRELLITSGAVAYIFDLDTLAFTGPIAGLVAHQGAFLESYFLALDRTTSTLRLSDQYAGTTWNPTQFAQRSLAGDRWQAMAVAHGEIWLFGSESSEVWYNSGAYPFPFAPRPDGVLEEGIAAPFSVARVGSNLIWLTKNDQGQGRIVMAVGYQAQPISDRAVEYWMQSYSTLADAVGWTYQDQGHTFYVLTFPTARATWVFDLTENEWHERLYYDVATGSWDAYRAQFHAFAFGTHVVLDRATGNVYSLSVNTYTDVGGAALRRVRRAPHVYNGSYRTFYDRFEVDLEVGLGLASGQGSAPMMMARMSKDAGKTWGNERLIPIGPIGAYKTRAVWNRPGMARDAVFEIAFTDPVPTRIIDAYLDVTPGSN